MFIDAANKLTDLTRVFLEPTNSTHRQYEALRLSSSMGSREPKPPAYGYTPGSFRVLVHQFRRSPRRPFFLPPDKGPRQSPKSNLVRDQVVALASRTCRFMISAAPSRRRDAR